MKTHESEVYCILDSKESCKTKRKRRAPKSAPKKEEIPSFLRNLTSLPDNLEILAQNRRSVSYLGPIFFGSCTQQLHPPHHLVPLTSFYQNQFFAPKKEKLLKDIFLPRSASSKRKYESKEFHPFIRKRQEFVDPYPHRCPGVRKIFAPAVAAPEGFGQTVSTIEGEMSREIPFYRVKEVSTLCTEIVEAEFEIVTLSDIREEKRNCLPYKERIAHAHFPKEFVTVEICGPTIPASITIKKLPSRRKCPFEVELDLKSKSKKGKDKSGKSKEEPKEKAEEAKKREKEPQASLRSIAMAKEESFNGRPFGGDDAKGESDEIEDEGDRQQSEIIGEGEDRRGSEEEGVAAEREEEREPSKALVNEEGSLGAVEEENAEEEEN